MKTYFNFCTIGTCTIVDGAGGQSCAYFIRSFFPVFPYLVITFSYVMIIRKFREIRKNLFTENPPLERIRIPNEEISTSEACSEIVLTDKELTGNARLFRNSIASSSKIIFPWKKILFLFCLDSLRSNLSHPASPNLIESALQTLNNGKLKRRKKQEDHLTFTVGVIFAAYVICNLPASVVLLIDPHASKFTQV